MKNIASKVAEKVQDLLGFETRVIETVKTNDIVLTGIVIVDGKNGINPVIYIDRVTNAGYSVDDIVSFVTDVYKTQCDRSGADYNFISDYEKVKDNIMPTVVSKKSNTKLLSDIPYAEFFDLAVIFEIVCPFINGEYASVKINNGLLEMWNKTFDDVYAQAMQNLNKEGVVISNISEVLNKLGLDVQELDMGPFMYILSNEETHKGARHILNESVISQFAEKTGADLIIIPSSIHELILIPIQTDIDIDEFNQMVNYINSTEVSPDDVLSDHIYVYGRDGGWTW